MRAPEPEYLSKFRETLKAIAVEIPPEDQIAALLEVVVEYRRTISNYKNEVSILKCEISALHVQLYNLKQAVMDAAKSRSCFQEKTPKKTVLRPQRGRSL